MLAVLTRQKCMAFGMGCGVGTCQIKSSILLGRPAMVFWPLKTLFRRKITANNIYEACGMHVETIMHILCFCGQGIEVWSSSKLTLPFIKHDSWSFVDTFNRLRNRWEERPGLLEKWVTICWGIWKSRNEVRHGGKR